MPKVSTKKKNSAGKPYDCGKCPDLIECGQQYYEWSFRFGGTHRQHKTHGYPKPSQLTQSKLSGAYAAIESAEEQIAQFDNAEDIALALENCAEEISGVRDEHQESLDNMGENLAQGSTGEAIQEKIDELELFGDTIADLANDIRGEEFGEDEPETNSPERKEWEEKNETFIDGLRQQALDGLGEFSL